MRVFSYSFVYLKLLNLLLEVAMILQWSDWSAVQPEKNKIYEGRNKFSLGIKRRYINWTELN